MCGNCSHIKLGFDAHFTTQMNGVGLYVRIYGRPTVMMMMMMMMMKDVYSPKSKRDQKTCYGLTRGRLIHETGLNVSIC